ncbi:CCA-adding enzyme [Candidatus Cyrtobacter comes]|uniref:CCA-adding enzyme n=1 Tax=Candidatus Cyrtobacter comes TaxID=675776 RepID=A0ABU5L6B2_9RICK|nr:CCA tRNA nucleotidyltransferase [Candidatus Cyrtobacter comes]MDZ5761673.1 CCA-adding enzyme [Candidatus Cyrtobacter comes]
MKFQDTGNYKEAFHIISLLEKIGEARIVGGAVRDMLFSIEPKDLDIATTLKPEDVIKICKEAEIKFIPTGINFGTITAVVDGKNFEITTLRKDEKCDGRHAQVSFTTKWEDDASRRDFTINALYMDKHGNVYDYKGGIQDLDDKMIKFIDNPNDRIHEDHLRILRYFRFISYIGVHKIDSQSMESSIKYSYLLDKISGERIRAEILKTLSNPYAIEVISIMYKNNVLDSILIPKNFENIQLLNFSNDPIINLAYILFINKTKKEHILQIYERWKFSNKEKDRLSFLLFHEYKNLYLIDEPALKELTYEYGVERISDIIAFQSLVFNIEQKEALLDRVLSYEYPKFPISGFDLMDLGIHGKELNILLKKAKHIWIDSDFKKCKEQLIKELFI